MHRVERNVMVARNSHDRLSDAVQKMTRLGKFRGTGALRKVAADGDEIGTMLLEAMQKCRHLVVVMAAEVKIGNVRDTRHLTPLEWVALRA